jgi:pimeloyl-ACP methyl ester carboxylesterase
VARSPTVVLVHGAFTDASGYGRVIRRLQSKGTQVRAPMNPLRRLSFVADAPARYINVIEASVLLVGHCYGGAVISQAALTVTRTTGLVFLAAFALDVGETCASLQEPFPSSLLVSTAVASPYDAPGATGGPDLFIKIEEFHQTMCADLPDDLAAVMAVSQRPLSVGAFTEPATVAGWKSLPSWYMVCDRDNVISPEAERFMAKRMGAEVAYVDGSHVAFIARPDVATSLILKGVAGE